MSREKNCRHDKGKIEEEESNSLSHWHQTLYWALVNWTLITAVKWYLIQTDQVTFQGKGGKGGGGSGRKSGKTEVWILKIEEKDPGLRAGGVAKGAGVSGERKKDKTPETRGKADEKGGENRLERGNRTF